MTYYINNAFSPNMVDDEAIVKITRITEDDFRKACKTAYSVVGHPEFAEEFGVEYRRENISLLPGDVLFISTPGHRVKQECYTYIPPNQGTIYRRIEVLGDE